MTGPRADLVTEAGVRRYGELGITTEQLERWLKPRPDATDAAPADAYLACALLAGTPAAVAAFEREVAPALRAAIKKMDAPHDGLEDLLQAVRTKLLVGEGGQAPALAQFTGAGSLLAFCTTAAARLVLTKTRNEATRLAYEARSGGGSPAPLSPERAFSKEEQSAHFAEAFRASLRTLSARDRTLLRMNLVEGVPHEKLAALLGVNRVTVTRWLLEARAHLATATRQALAHDGSHSEAAESLLRSIESNFDVSMHRLLIEADDGAEPSGKA